MNKKIISLFSLSAASLLLLAACGETPTSKVDPTTVDPTSEPEPTTVDPTTGEPTSTPSGAVEVNFWVTMNPTITDRIISYANNFSKVIKQTDGVDVTVNVTYQGGYSDVMEKIVTGYSTGNTPTIVVAYPDHVAEYLTYNEDFVVNLDKYINDPEVTFGTDPLLGDDIEGTDDFIESYFQEGQNYLVDGTYSLPLQKSTELMYYNKNVVEKLLAPKFKEPGETMSHFMNNLTWDTFMEMCEDVRKDIDNGGTTYGNTLQVPAYYDSDGNFFITQSFQRGIPYVSYDKEQGQAQILFDNADSKKMIKDLADLNGYDKNKALMWTKGSNEDKYGSDAFKNWETLFSIASTGGAGYQSSEVFQVGVCPIPAVDPENRQYVSQGVTLALLNNIGLSEAKNEMATLYGWKFLKYLTTPDVNTDICLTSQGYLPVRHSAIDSDDYQEFLADADEDLIPGAARCVIEQLKYNYFNSPVFKGSAYAREQVGGIVTQALLATSAESLDLDTLFAEAVKNVKLHM